MQIKFIPRGIDKVKAYLKSLPRGVKKVAEEALSKYLIGAKPHGLMHYSPYKYVTRKRAYGSTGATFENGSPVPPGYFSKEQFRYVMAMIAEGRIDPGVPHRTGKGQRGWKLVETTKNYQIVNKEVSMYYSMSDKGQARLNKLAGWRLVSAAIKANLVGAFKAANAAVKKFLKSKG